MTSSMPEEEEEEEGDTWEGDSGRNNPSAYLCSPIEA